MKSQKGSAHVVVVIILVLALLGALGFIFWQNFMQKNDTITKTEDKVATKQESKNVDIKTDTLKIPELGKSLDLSTAKYDDITYEMTSVNRDDVNKYIVAIYSKDLNARLVADAKKGSPDMDYTTTYNKLSANRAVYAYYYQTTPESDNIIDGVARDIISVSEKTSSSKLFVGFMGPGNSSTEALSTENSTFREWVTANLK
jgi:cytoskeletal protein RodZ